VPENVYCVNTVYFISYSKHFKYFLAYLNTKLIDWYYRTLSVQLGEKAVRMFSIYVSEIPIPKLTPELESRINTLVDKRNNQNFSSQWQSIEDEIEKIFFDIFSLTEEEQCFIRNS
jgi:hypothetical protein